MKPKGTDVKLTTAAQVVKLLRERYPSPAWAFFENVGDGTGMNQRRWADGFAMSLWPSRGLVFHGFEVKVSRQDVMRELATPQKADAVAKYCDYWWLAVGAIGIVDGLELPPAWGLLAPVEIRGKQSLRVVKEATKLDAKEIDRTFTAAILRRAAEHFDVERIRQEVRYEIHEEIRAKLEAEFGPEYERQISSLKAQLDSACRDREAAESRLTAALGKPYHISVIAGAIDFLRWLDGWSTGQKAIESAVRGVQIHIDALEDARKQLGVLRVLMQTMNEKKDPEPPPEPGHRPPGYHLGDTHR